MCKSACESSFDTISETNARHAEALRDGTEDDAPSRSSYWRSKICGTPFVAQSAAKIWPYELASKAEESHELGTEPLNGCFIGGI